MGWGEAGQEDPQTRELRMRDDKSLLCLGSGWREPGHLDLEKEVG